LWEGDRLPPLTLINPVIHPICPAIQMTQPPTHELTQLLIAWSDGDRAALDKLTPIVYEELRRLARRYMSREGKGHTLQTTALVHEAYLRLFNRQSVQWQNRTHFFAIAAQLMRCILVDHARSHAYQKRGGKARQVSLDEAAVISQDRASEVIELDEALKALAAIDPQQSRIVELRFFGGLSVDETAEVLCLSAATIKREWSSAKLWLHREISKRG
jgi:RNA polymerase sigma factor (TIGR02999 family)